MPRTDAVLQGVFNNIVLLVAVIVVYCLSLIMYNRFFSPPARYPGPFLWTVFRWPYVVSLLHGNHVREVKRIHNRYGSIVRIAPNELSYVDARAWKDIYGHQKSRGPEFRKNPIWKRKSPEGSRSIMDADSEKHARMRKTLMNALSPKALKDQELLVQKYIDNWIHRLRELTEAGDGEAMVGMRDYLNWSSFDIIVRGRHHEAGELY